ncbi:FLYWCH-type domain-containing protein, partial [Aphis craccivora]
MAEIINSNGGGKFLHIDGHLYYKHSENKGRLYWCFRPQSFIHDHAPNLEEVYVLKVMTDIKRKASEHPEAPPILRTELQQVPAGILAELREHQKRDPGSTVHSDEWRAYSTLKNYGFLH